METTTAVDGNVTQATFLHFIDEYSDVDQAVAQAVGMRKDLRKRIRGAGLNLAAFDRARAEAEKSGEKRETEDREFRRNMAWLGKPVGFQADWVNAAGYSPVYDASPPPQANGEDKAAISEHQVHQVERAGRAAGEGGHDRSSNPWTPGSFLYQRWDEKWMEGQTVLAEGMAPKESASSAPPVRRRPGRPPGARNKKSAAVAL